MTLRDATTQAAATIDKRDAELLLAHILQCDRVHLAARPDAELTTGQQVAFTALVSRRAAHEPLQYILGHHEFYGLDFRVTPAVLIPRPETEHLVEAVLLWATRFHEVGFWHKVEHTLRIADVGTGSGAIAIALATHLAGATFTATDISPAALAIARENAQTHGCEDRIQFLHYDLLPPEIRFDAIVSNPPYVPAADAATMQPEVVLHEPHTALFAGADGLELYRRLIPAARAALVPEGLLALEIGYGQRHALTHLLDGWNDIRFVDDYAGIPRIVLAHRPA